MIIIASIDILIVKDLETIKPLLTQWEKVMMFFLLRQLIAPCVETMILLDRVMYLMENGIVNAAYQVYYAI